MRTKCFLGFDLGASSGRAMLGYFDGEKLTLRELHRFPNDPVEMNGRLVWDVPRLFFEMKAALTKAAREGVEIDSIAIDTWGVDFALVDKNGNLCAMPLNYRDHMTDGILEKAFSEVMSREKLFERTGLAMNQFNTLFQLYALKNLGDPALETAASLMFMPDYLAFLLTGEMGTEYTAASTGQLIDPSTRDWAWDVIDAFGIPRRLFGRITQPGTLRGRLKKSIADECGVPQIPVIAAPGHDTASAVVAVPAAGDDFAYISSGTWSLLGAELNSPVTDKSVMDANYTNEGGVYGTIRLLRNIMGLWIINECKRVWDRRFGETSFEEIVRLAAREKPFAAIIDVDDPRFLSAGDMPARIAEYCAQTGQKAPDSIGGIARVVFESLALMYRWGVDALGRDILKKPVSALHVVGGGSKNEMLNAFTASAVGVKVTAGPTEATVIGNLMIQAAYAGCAEGLNDIRRVVANSFPVREYLPDENRDMWENAYARLLELMKERR